MQYTGAIQKILKLTFSLQGFIHHKSAKVRVKMFNVHVKSVRAKIYVAIYCNLCLKNFRVFNIRCIGDPQTFFNSKFLLSIYGMYIYQAYPLTYNLYLFSVLVCIYVPPD